MPTRRTFDEIDQERRARFSLCSSCKQYYVGNCPETLDTQRNIKRCPYRKYQHYKTVNFGTLRVVQRAFPEEFVVINKTGEKK